MADYDRPVINKLFVSPALTADSIRQVVLPPGADWLTVWSCSGDGVVYVLDHAGTGLPTDYMPVTSFPTCIDIRAFQELSYGSDTEGAVVRFRLSPRRPARCRP